MVMNFVVGFSPYDVCAAAFTPIHTIQGSGLSAADHRHRHDQRCRGRRLRRQRRPPGLLPAGPDRRRRSGHLGRHLRLHRQFATWSAPGRWCASPGYARERFNQTTLNGSNSNTAAVPAANIVACGTGSVAPTDVTMPFAGARRPGALRGHAGALPAGAGDRRVLQLRPLRRDRAGPAARRRDPAVHRHRASTSRAPRPTPAPWRTACAGSPSTTRQSAQNPRHPAPPERRALLA